MPALHADEVPTDAVRVHAIIGEQCPQWADLPLEPAGSGTDNTMYRLGEELLVRLPRTAANAKAITKEQSWLPVLPPHLPLEIPRPVHRGEPTGVYPLVWSVYQWIDGEQPGQASVTDWARFGTDLAAFVTALHATDLGGATRAGELSWYRGGSLAPGQTEIGQRFAEVRELPGIAGRLDLDELQERWETALALPEPDGPLGWLHGDLKPSNLLVRDGRLCAVIDFGGLSVGHPDAEHATVWDLPQEARAAYLAALRLDPLVWQRSTAWAIAVGISGIPYYWHTYPAFVDECLARLQAITRCGDGAAPGR